MRRLVLLPILLVSAVIILSNSCRKENSTKGLTKLDQIIPTAFPVPRYSFEDNPLTVEGFELGKKLFYDTLLSDDHEISCGSCHEQKAAFEIGRAHV